MTKLGVFFAEMQLEMKCNANQLAERLSIDPTIISKAKKGRRRFFEHSSLLKMVAGVSDDPYVKARLVAAVLEDIKESVPGVDTKRIEILLKQNGRIAESPTPYKSDSFAALSKAARESALDSQALNALQTLIGEMQTNPTIRTMVIALAKLSTEEAGKAKQ